jgi:hypothetical protein
MPLSMSQQHRYPILPAIVAEMKGFSLYSDYRPVQSREQWLDGRLQYRAAGGRLT